MADHLTIVVYGFYGRFNCGDDQYEETMTTFLEIIRPRSTIHFVSPDKRAQLPVLLDSCDILIVGGGDVLNEWFLGPLHDALEMSRTDPLKICVSVGIPYPDIINEGRLDLFDHFFLRSRADLSSLSLRYGRECVHYLPDLSVFLCGEITKRTNDRVHRIAICLARPIYHESRSVEYRKILKQLALGIVSSDIVKHRIKVHLISFNQDTTNDRENDLIINDDFEAILNKQIAKKRLHHVMVVNERNLIHYRDVFELIGKMDMTIAMRFHSIWFSMLQGVPFLPIYSTRKVHNLLTYELAYSLGIEMKTDARLVPIELDHDMVKCKLNYLCESIDLFQKKLVMLCRAMRNEYERITPFMITMFHDPGKYRRIKSKNKIDFLESAFTTWLNTKRDQVMSNWKEHKNLTIDEAKFGAGLCLMGVLKVPNPESLPYFYGLFEKIKSGASINLTDDLSWVYMDYHQKDQQSSSAVVKHPLINTSFIPQRTNGKYHRFGWEHCMDIMEQMEGGDLLMDVYLDRTFGWNVEYLKAMGILPYDRPWVGFVHHCFLPSYSKNNCFALVKEPMFVESLKTCKGLFVLSKALEGQLKHAMILLDLPYVPIYTLYHPTGFVEDKTFNWDRFMASEQKQLVHVGAWYRDTYSFYMLNVDSTPFKKYALIGKDMEGYFDPAVCSERYFYCDVLQREPPRTTPKETGFLKKLLESMKRLLRTSGMTSTKAFLFDAICRDTKPISSEDTDCMCRSLCRDIWTEIEASEFKEQITALIEQIEGQVHTVQFIRELDDPAYDDLLSSSIIFLRLFDASAVNTVIEAIVRNTPIIVNRLPALVEYLGPTYPLFYDNLSEVPRLLDYGMLLEGHRYLQRMDKGFLSAPNFYEQLVAILSSL